jgi:periplasmic protein CpxP/Spy
MTYIRNNKVLVFIIAILLLSNIALLFFFLREDKKEKPKKSPREYMIEKLRGEVGFSDQQITQYEQLSDKHKESMKPLFESMRQAKDSLYKLLLQQPSDSLVNHYLDRIGEKQKNIDQRIFAHFLSLKQLCTPEQLPKYDTVIQRVIKGMISPPKKGANKDKDHK